MSKTNAVIIGVDPHKMSVTIEVIDTHEQLLGGGRFDTTNAGYAAMRRYVKQWPDRLWAVEGANGAARILGLNPSTLRTRINKLGISRTPPQAAAS